MTDLTDATNEFRVLVNEMHADLLTADERIALQTLLADLTALVTAEAPQ